MQLYHLSIKDFLLCQAFMEKLDGLIQNHNDINTPNLDKKVKTNHLQLAIRKNFCLNQAYAMLKQTKITAKDTLAINYEECFNYIHGLYLLHNILSPLITSLHKSHAASSSLANTSIDDYYDVKDDIATMSAFLSSIFGCTYEKIQ